MGDLALYADCRPHVTLHKHWCFPAQWDVVGKSSSWPQHAQLLLRSGKAVVGHQHMLSGYNVRLTLLDGCEVSWLLAQLG